MTVMSAQPVEVATVEIVDFVEPLAPTAEELDAVDLMWMEKLAQPFHPTPHRPFRQVRCTGLTRNGPRAGRQCPHPSVLGTNVCIHHGAQLPIVRQAAQRRVDQARLRLIDSADDAVDWLLDLGKNSASDAVRLGAAKEVLDRAGVRGGVEVDVSVTEKADPATVLREKISQVRERIVTGEVVPSVTDDVEVVRPSDTVAESTQAPDAEEQLP